MPETLKLHVGRVVPKQPVTLSRLEKEYGFRRKPWRYSSSVLVGRYIYVTGRFGSHNVDGRRCTVVGVLDIVNSCWRWVQCEGPAQKLASTVLYEDYVYWFGDVNWVGNQCGALSRFDLTLEEWQGCSFAGEGPGLRKGVSAHVLEDQKQIFLFGGRIGNRKQNDVYLLDMRRNMWVDVIVKGTPPEARWKHGSWMRRGVFYCAGGWNDRGDYAQNGVFMLHFNKLNVVTWSRLETNRPRWKLTDFTAIPLHDSDCVLIFGGIGVNSHGAQVYDLSSGVLKAATILGRQVSLLSTQAGVETNSGIILFQVNSEDSYARVTQTS